jgi:hypothetical protein
MAIKDTIDELNSDSNEKNLIESSNASEKFPDDNDSSLEALVREQQTYVRDRLSVELGREPIQEEIDDWLNEHTEGY